MGRSLLNPSASRLSNLLLTEDDQSLLCCNQDLINEKEKSLCGVCTQWCWKSCNTFPYALDGHLTALLFNTIYLHKTVSYTRPRSEMSCCCYAIFTRSPSSQYPQPPICFPVALRRLPPTLSHRRWNYVHVQLCPAQQLRC